VLSAAFTSQQPRCPHLTADITNSAAAAHSPVLNGFQPTAVSRRLFAQPSSISVQGSFTRVVTSGVPNKPQTLRRLLSSNATSSSSQPVQLVASETGPTITGVTPAKLQQYLYELCRAVSQVSSTCPSELCCALQQSLWALVLQGRMHNLGCPARALASALQLVTSRWRHPF
jgi:hypothetical protein